MPKPIMVTDLTLHEVPRPRMPIRGAARFSDGKGYRFTGTLDAGFIFETAPAYRTRRTRWFGSPARTAALRAWFHENDTPKHTAS